MSLFRLIKNPNAQWRSYIDMEHATCYSQDNYWAALTDGTWKYIWFFRTGKEQLFNLKNDPGEITELSQKKEYSDELSLWRQRMVEHLSERGEGFVKDGKLVVRKETMLYSPNFPEDDRDENQRIRDWREIYKGVDLSDL
jgi:arylsulfatase